MAAELIGRCKCPICGSDKARLTLAKSLLSVLTCNGCNFQGFARSDRADEKLRGLLIAEPKPDQQPAAVPAAPAPQAAPAAVAPQPEPVQGVKTSSSVWGAW